MRKPESGPFAAGKTLFFLRERDMQQDKAAVEMVCAALALAVLVLACRIVSLM